MKKKILTIPGYGGSDKDHWQTYWENEYPDIERVEQLGWNTPEKDLWVDTLDQYVNSNTDTRYILVAHSLGCAIVAHWADRYDSSLVSGALLVSVSDVDSPKHTPDEVRNFAPMPVKKLPFRSIIVASENDPYVSFERAEQISDLWGSEFVNIGKCGHINSKSKLSSWESGKEILQRIYNV